jgi:endonuclease/exonuclease/phosphatase family metal-dependent hydrolase
MLLDKLFYKGMLITKFTWDNLSVVVINTHLLANFVGDWERHGIYARVEEQQLHQLAKIVQTQPEECLILVVGDFNIPRGSKLYDDFLANSGLIDLLTGDTRPTHRLPPGIPARFALPIDYALVRVPQSHHLEIQCDLCFSGKHSITDHRQGYLSDHQGIEIHITKR